MDLPNSFTAAKSTKFPTKPTLGYPPHLKYVAALPRKTWKSGILHFVCLSVCLLATLRKNFGTDLHEIFREGWQRASEQITKIWWRSVSPSGFRDCFHDSSLLGDKESGINRLRCATLQCRACTSRHRYSTYDVVTSPRQTVRVGLISRHW